MVALAGLVSLASAGDAAAGTLLGSAGGLDYFRATTASVPPPFGASAVAACDSADREAGGGILPAGAANQAFVSATHGYGSPVGWFGRFENISGSDKTAQVYAVCTGRQVRERNSGGREVKAGRTKVVRAPCPDGAHVSGGGGQLTNYKGDLDHRLVSSHPFDDRDPNHAPDDGWKVRFYNFDATKKGDVFAYSECLKTDRLRYRRTTTFSLAQCPDGSHVTGGGVEHDPSDRFYAWINTSAPADTLGDDNSIPDDAWFGLGRDNTRAKRVHAICLT